MARRVALARAIALDPELIMYDEPFAGLDPISMGVAANLIRTLNDTTGATSLVVSHDVQRVLRDLRLRLPDVVAAAASSPQGTPERAERVRQTRRCASSSAASPTARCGSTTRRRRSPKTSECRMMRRRRRTPA